MRASTTQGILGIVVAQSHNSSIKVATEWGLLAENHRVSWIGTGRFAKKTPVPVLSQGLNDIRLKVLARVYNLDASPKITFPQAHLRQTGNEINLQHVCKCTGLGCLGRCACKKRKTMCNSRCACNGRCAYSLSMQAEYLAKSKRENAELVQQADNFDLSDDSDGA
jgi:hypothetical protein